MTSPRDPTPQEPPTTGRRRLLPALAVALAVGGLIALMVVGLANRGVETDIAEALAAGERLPAPDLALPVLAAGDGVGPAGGEVALSDLRGRTVVLNVWASWCGPCEAEASLLEALARDYRAQGGEVLVLGLDVRDVRDDALAFIEELELTYPSLRDNGVGADDALEITGVPETFVIDPQGRIAARHIGPVVRAEQVTELVERAQRT